MAMRKPRLRRAAGTRVVACLGSSSTAERGTYDWIGDVAKRPGNESWLFLRFATGGDLAYNGMRRTGDIIASSPGAVIILLGGNDVLASVFPKVARVLGGWKRACKKRKRGRAVKPSTERPLAARIVDAFRLGATADQVGSREQGDVCACAERASLSSNPEMSRAPSGAGAQPGPRPAWRSPPVGRSPSSRAPRRARA